MELATLIIVGTAIIVCLVSVAVAAIKLRSDPIEATKAELELENMILKQQLEKERAKIEQVKSLINQQEMVTKEEFIKAIKLYSRYL